MSYQLWQEICSHLTEIDEEQSLLKKQALETDRIVAAQKKFGALFEQLRISLEQKLAKEHVSLMLFALIATVDEEMQCLDYIDPRTRWSPLQKDFFGAHTAGEIFFKKIDDHLDDPTIPSIVYELYYLMIKRGFQGKYRNSKTHLLKYLDLLKQKISLASPQIHKAPVEKPVPREPKKVATYYWVALLCCGGVYCLLLLLSKLN